MFSNDEELAQKYNPTRPTTSSKRNAGAYPQHVAQIAPMPGELLLLVLLGRISRQGWYLGRSRSFFRRSRIAGGICCFERGSSTSI